MEKKQISYVKNYGGTEYVVIATESRAAKETVTGKLKKVLLQDLFDKVRSEGENL